MFSIYFIQLKFRSYSDVRKGPAAMLKGERERNDDFTKAMRKRIQLIKAISHKYFSTSSWKLETWFYVKKYIIFQMRLISLFFYYSLNFKPESFECHEKQYLYSMNKTILLQLLTSTLQFFRESMGRVGFLRPVLDMFCNDLSLKEAPLSCSFLLQKGWLNGGCRL